MKKSSNNMDKAQELYARKRQGSHSGSRGGSKKSNSTHGDRAQVFL